MDKIPYYTTGITDPVWKEDFKVRSFDIDFAGDIRVSSIFSYFQEVASTHAEKLGVGFKFVTESGMVWVLYRLSLRFHQFPKWEDEISIETWPLGNEKLCYRRDFIVKVGEKVYITAASHWLLIDLNSKKPHLIALNEDILSLNKGKYALDTVTSNLPAVDEGHSGVIEVGYTDLDQNRHVNNARYVEWIFDQLDMALLERNKPIFFAVEFKHEVLAGDVVNIKQKEEQTAETAILMEGTITGSNRVCFRSRIAF